MILVNGALANATVEAFLPHVAMQICEQFTVTVIILHQSTILLLCIGLMEIEMVDTKWRGKHQENCQLTFSTQHTRCLGGEVVI